MRVTIGPGGTAKVLTRHFMGNRNSATMRMTTTRENWILRRCYFTPNGTNRYKVYDNTYKGTPTLVRYESKAGRAGWNTGHPTRILRTTIFPLTEGPLEISLPGRGEAGGEGTGFPVIGRRNRSGLFWLFCAHILSSTVISLHVTPPSFAVSVSLGFLDRFRVVISKVT